jgi:transposase
MMGWLTNDQWQLFYRFDLDEAVPEDHLVRKIDAALDLSWLRSELAPHYSSLERPSIDPELMVRMLVVGYVFAIRSERLICSEVQVNLAYRWFCKLGIEDAIPDHSAFSRARNERFRGGDVFRRVFERVVEACIAAGLVGGEGFAVARNLDRCNILQHNPGKIGSDRATAETALMTPELTSTCEVCCVILTV